MNIQLLDQQQFAPEWVKSAVFYQIFPDRFAKSDAVQCHGTFEKWDSKPTYHNMMGGNLRGIIERLDYLSDFGITALYLCPIFTSASNHRYHTHDYFEIDPILGNLDDFKELVSAAHERSIRIILDGVFNHCSRGFFQFNTILEQGEESPFRDWFHIKKYPIRPYSKTKEVEYECWWNNKALPKFNTKNPEVRGFIFEVAEYWLNLGIDGWRLDVPNEIDDDSFWQEFRSRVKQINPEAYIVGEIWEDPDRWLGGDQFDGVMNYRVRQAILNLFFVITKQDQSSLGGKVSTEHFMRLITAAMQINEPHAQMNLLGSHDTHRIMNHAKGNIGKLKQCFALMFFLPGSPCIYYGDEIGMSGGKDPDCRKAFDWDSRNWKNELKSFISELISLKKESKSLQIGHLSVKIEKHELVVSREYAGEFKTLKIDMSPKSSKIVIQ